MGTRNLICIIRDNKVVMAQYGQNDGYPSFTGAKIIEMMEDYGDYPHIYKSLNKLSMEYDQKNSVFDKIQAHSSDVLYAILNLNLSSYVTVSSLDFISDLDCEWLYVIDLDTNTLSVRGHKLNEYDLKNLPSIEQLIKDCEENV